MHALFYIVFQHKFNVTSACVDVIRHTYSVSHMDGMNFKVLWSNNYSTTTIKIKDTLSKLFISRFHVCFWNWIAFLVFSILRVYRHYYHSLELDIPFRQITTFIKVHVVFVFGLQTLQLIDFIKFFQLKGLKPKHKDHTNLYERCDLTKKFI